MWLNVSTGGYLVNDPTHKTADNVPDKEEAGNPGPEEEVDLDGIPRARAVHHLRNGHTGE